MYMAIGRHEHRPFRAKRSKDRVETASFDKRARCRDNFAVGCDWHSCGVGELAPVRFKEIGAAVADVIAALGVDDYPCPGLSRGPDDLESDTLSQHAFAVIRDNDDGVVGHKLA